MQKVRENTTGKKEYNMEDYNYIIKTVQYLQNTHGIIFFITTKDFDIIFRWWEKRIPVEIIKKSISNVVERWKAKKKNIYSFLNFSYEVRKNFKVFLEMSVGEEIKEKSANEYEDIENFFKNYPEELIEIKGDFEKIYQKFKNQKDFKIKHLYYTMIFYHRVTETQRKKYILKKIIIKKGI